MKALILVFVLSMSSAMANAEDWTTSDGTCYKNVRVIRVEDDAITIIYKDGGALVPIFKLPTSLQERFDYDPKKAKAAAEARAAADAKSARELQAEIERTEALHQAQLIKDAAATTAGKNAAPPSKN